MPLTELALHLPNRPGQLVRVARILAEGEINVAAISVDSTAKSGSVRMVVSDPTRALELLTKAGYHVRSDELLAVHLEDRAGSFLRVLDVLAQAKVNVQSVAILVVREGGQALVALGVDDSKRAQRHLTQSGFLSPTAERLVSNADLLAARPTLPSESVGLHL
ncbi:MAG TPA: ACT domain-containing protein [Thermoplasmata archaeon]|nr:ACT domain-containing protein [Thermoplasmata archaeon]